MNVAERDPLLVTMAYEKSVPNVKVVVANIKRLVQSVMALAFRGLR